MDQINPFGPQATITVTRTRQWANKARGVKLFLNGEAVGKIRDGKSQTFRVKPGLHSLEAKVDWCRTQPLQLRIADGGSALVEVGCNAMGWKLLLVTWYALVDTKNYLYLRLK